MTKSKKFVSRMMFALVILTLVSFCFVGFTFARYTSSGSMAAEAKVAHWEITATDFEGTETLNFGMISPAKEPYSIQETPSYDENKVRKNEIKDVTIATITNKSDVSALVKVNVSELDWTIDTTNLTKKADGTAFAEGENKTDYVKGLIAKHIKVSYKFTDSEYTTAGNFTPGSGRSIKAHDDVPFVVTATLTWTSDLDATIFGDKADAEDTIIGQCVSGFSCTISYTAVQDSIQPVPPTEETPAA